MKLSVVLASRNEIPMLMMTVLSAVEQLKADGIDGEVFIVDNSDPEVWPGVEKTLAGQLKDKTVRVVHEESPAISVALDRAHLEARGEYLFYTDAHTLIGHGTLAALLAFHEANKDRRLGYVHAPIQWAHSSAGTRKTHFGLNKSLLGGWGDSVTATTPVKVTWKGMPYLIRKDVFEAIGGMGCCAEHKVSWGVMHYMGIKPWLFGYENWAIPDGVAYHFGEWPEPARQFTQYRTYRSSGKTKPGLGLALSAYVFGGEELLRGEYVRANLSRFFSSYEAALEAVKPIGEKEREWLLANQTISFQDLIESAPWGNITKVVDMTITPQYAQLNQQLHENPEVKYGYKGYQQADSVLQVIKRHRIHSVLDYGAGKQTLSAALREKRFPNVKDYDPAVPVISAAPSPAELVVCTDVLEHVEPGCLDDVLKHLRDLTQRYAYIRVCTVPCTSKSLPDGSDPHKLIYPKEWWLEKLGAWFKVSDTLEQGDQYFTLLLKPKRP